MPAQVIITEPARNIVEITTTTNSVSITEQVNTVSVSSSTVTGTGAGTTSGIINITNTIGDAISGEFYPSGTSLETIIRDIVAPFFEPTFVSISYNATDSQSSGNDLLVECGLTSTISQITLVWTNPENLDNNSPLTFLDITDTTDPFDRSFNIANYGAAASLTQNISPAYVVDAVASPQTTVLRVGTAFLGNDGAGAPVALTKDFNIFHRHRFYVISSQLSTISTLANLLSDGTTNTVISTLAAAPNTASQSIAVDCNSNTVDSNTFTYILIPRVIGRLGEVAAEVNGKGVADYTDSFIEDDNSGSFYDLNIGNTTPQYRAYRSRQPGAFDSDITLNIEIKT